MNLPPITQSLRFKISGMTSAVVFGLGGLALAAIYIFLLSEFRSITRRAVVALRGDGVFLQLGETSYRTWESFAKEAILNRVASVMVIVLPLLFLASLVVGWFVAGRALHPVNAITRVAQEIEATDLSRRIALAGPDDELTRMASTFNAMLDRLDHAFRGQKDVLARTSHDLRTPLAIIRSNLDVTMSDPDVTIEEWRATGAIAARAAERMTRMIDDILAAARLEAGAPTLVNVDLAGLAVQAVQDFRARASEIGAELTIRAEPALVLGDRLALGRAVGNLLENAVMASGQGMVVGVVSGRVDDWGFVAVHDRGPGVDPAIVRGERTVRGHLGLVIVREIGRRHGGHLDAVKRKGGGSVVALWVPLGAGTGSERPPMSALPVF